ncbi:MAG: SDR family NAD(P)-dependent oxidoreductase [Candidatus Schekmanbacteria bacterium]|nr:SDR family NAD(P)-dependent oxidoreductase [Candidatus Schekmanbacteria bacterium]
MTAPDVRLLLEKAALEVKRLRARVAELETTAHEPVAVVGLGCRFPGGANDPAAFWALLATGRDAVVEIPESRWPAPALPPGLRGSRWAGLLDADLSAFDAGFFGISPREAASLDPQQRLILEVAWEALEHAGQAADRLRGSNTGVFMALSNLDYQDLVKVQPDEALDAYSATGNLHSTAAGRLSYALDLQGPCLCVDTACSGSLVAVHLACRSLLAGECGLALAGGAHVMLSPLTMHLEALTQGLASDGRCKTFDARADGFVRGEGCGVVALKRLSDARKAGDRVWAVLKGSAVNQDGHSTGLTAPNVLSQERLLREALERARVRAEDISYVEAHGTGTSLGDPIETDALASVFRARGDGSTCFLGSVKTNIGHLEAAAGVAGLIKVLLALNAELIPRHLHLQALNPRIRLDGSALAIPVEPVPWPRGDQPRRAGISSFGISGTNVHVVVEEAPPPDKREPLPAAAPEEAVVLPLSTRCPEALGALAGAYRAALEADRGALANWPVGAIARAAAVRRGHHPVRAALVARSRAELVDGLARVADEEWKAARAVHGRPRIAFVFPGQGGQWPGMGRRLLEAEPVFRAAIAECERALSGHVSWSLSAQLTADETSARLSEIDVVQPVIWAFEVALAALFRSWGVEPDAVIGHSMGEVAAAHVAGALALGDAATVIARRSQLMRGKSGRGAMGLLELSEDAARAAIKPFAGRLEIAALNGPRATVVSGDAAALEVLLAEMEHQGVFSRAIKVDVASHCSEVDDLLPPLVRALAVLSPKPAARTMFSTVSGTPVGGHELDGAYWARNLRDPVRFAAGVAALADEERDTVFVEISPHPILVAAVEDTLAQRGKAGRALATVRRDEDPVLALRRTLAGLYVAGHAPSWVSAPAEPPPPLPTYPWQRESHWVATHALVALSRRIAGSRPSEDSASHPLLGKRLEIACEPDTVVWRADISIARAPFLADHRVGSSVVLPASAYVDMALSAARELGGAEAVELERIELTRLLDLAGDGAQEVQTALQLIGQGRARFRIFSRIAGEPEQDSGSARWLLHAHGRLRWGETTPAAPPAYDPAGLAEARRRCGPTLSPDAHYEAMARCGIGYGPAFRTLAQVAANEHESLVEVDGERHDGAGPFVVHPAVLDACLQAVATLPGVLSGTAVLPVRLAGARVFRPARGRLLCHARRGEEGGQSSTEVSARLRILRPDGEVVAEVDALTLRRTRIDEVAPTEPERYAVVWRPRPRGDRGVPATPPPESTIQRPTTSPPVARGRRDLSPSPDRLQAARNAHHEDPPPDLPPLAGGGIPPHLPAQAGEGTEGPWLQGDGGSQTVDTALQASLLCGRRGDTLDALARAVRAAGSGRVCCQVVDSGSEAVDWSAALSRAEADCGAPLAVVVWLGEYPAAAASSGAPGAGTPLDRCAGDTMLLVELVRAILRAGYREPPRLILQTRGGQPVLGQGEDVIPEQACIWGFARTLMHEHPQLRCALVDLDPSEPPGELAPLAAEIAASDGEDQIGLRAGDGDGPRRFVARLVPCGSDHPAETRRLTIGERPSWTPSAGGEQDARPPRLGESMDESYSPARLRSFALLSPFPGALDQLAFRAHHRRRPGVGEVEIEVHAAGINFLDVLLALGALPDPATDGWGPPLGRECAGRLTAIGSGVTGIGVGDEVIALASRCFATHAMARAELVVPRPAGMSAVEAATIPLAFLTAHYALREVGRLAPGERVLIHAAAGGVGLAAVQVAQRLGAEIFATASSEAKHGLLRTLGVQHVFSSRDLSFVDAVRAATGGEGVDVVLNSLSGEQLAASLGLLRDYGRFVEIGKRDYLEGRRLDLTPFSHQLTMALVDLRAMMCSRPSKVRELLLEVMGELERGSYRPVRHRAVALAEAAVAFHEMARGEHLGKLVIETSAAQAVVIGRAVTRPRVRADRAYLITGGLGGVGLRLAEWLFAAGARSLALMGRSAPTAAAAARVAALRARGANVLVVRGDVAVRADAAAALARIATELLTPLGGVIHAAGVLDDGVILNLTAEQVRAVMRPKVTGAWNLHELTREMGLELFALCSSAGAVLGSPGQGGYTAANAFLDGLAHHRSANGLPAVSINWGAWSDVGLAAADDRRGRRLAAQGIESMAPDDCARAFALILDDGAVQGSVLRLVARRYRECHLAVSRAPFLSELPDDVAAAPALRSGVLTVAWSELPPEQRRDALRDHVREQIGRVLRCDPTRLAEDVPLQQRGLDSLMAMELRNRLEATLGINLGVTLIWRYPTVAALADFLAERVSAPLLGSAASPVAPSAPEPRPAGGEDAGRIARLLRAVKHATSERDRERDDRPNGG